MNFKKENIPYYFVKILLTPLGIKEVARYWKEKIGYKRVLNHIMWANADYNIYNEPQNHNVPVDPIWIYWKQGFDNAPEIVKRCVESINKFKGNHDIVYLTMANIKEYVKLPDYIETKHDKGIISEAHYSDMVRLQLLIMYGGIWMDATCYNTDRLPKKVDEAPFFMFSSANWWPSIYNPSKCSNWYIKSHSSNGLLIKVRNFLFEHWSKRNKPLHYYVFHYALSALVDTDADCRRIWNAVPFISNIQPHALRYSWSDPYDEKKYKDILSQCFIHKCTYKFDKTLMAAKPINNLQYLLKELQD